jgi:cobalt-zinc-cadmium efflux system protein
LASVGVVAASVVIFFTGRVIADSLAGIFIAVIILIGSARLLKEAIHILLEGVPKHIRLNDVVQAMSDIPGVAHVDDTHIWNLCSHLCSLSAHITIHASHMGDQQTILTTMNSILRDRFCISHSTIQVRSTEWK